MTVGHPTLESLTTLGTTLELSETAIDPRRRAPLPGEHTPQAIREFAFTEAEIQQLMRSQTPAMRPLEPGYNPRP